MHTQHRTARPTLVSLLALLLAGFVSVGTTSAAQASGAAPADVYRYWAYYTVKDDAFVAQQTGPAGATPKDGDIEGYRYAAPANYKQPNLPRADLSVVTFDAVCGDKTAESGQKRVAVLIDYGVEEDADAGATPPEPEALCAVVPAKANGLQTLQSVAPDLRTQKSSFGPLLCGISGYPATGCADVKAKTGTPADGAAVTFTGLDDGTGGSSGSDTSAASSSDSDDSNAPLLIGIGVLVVVIVGGGLLLQRRNRAAA